MSSAVVQPKSKKPSFQSLTDLLDSNHQLERMLLEGFSGAKTAHEALGIIHRTYPNLLSEEQLEEVYEKIVQLFERNLNSDVREQVMSLLMLTADSMRNKCVVDIPRDYYPGIEDGNGIFFFDDGYIQVYRPFKEFVVRNLIKTWTRTTVATEWLRCLTNAREVGFRRMRMVGQSFFTKHTVTEIIKERSNGECTEDEYDVFKEASQVFVEKYRDTPNTSLDACLRDIIVEVIRNLELVLRALWIGCPSCGRRIHVP